MDDLSSTILLPIFKFLDSFEIVKIRPVCRKWWEITEETRSLWRRPILPRRENGWPASTLELFDRKSQSTLKEVSIHLRRRSTREARTSLIGCLERSKESLRFLTMTNLPPESRINGLSWKLPHLVEFKLTYGGSDPRLSLRWNEFEDSKTRLGSGKDSSNLKVLWGGEFSVLFESHLHLLNNLTSLSVLQSLKSSEWRRVLEVPSKTLKHLRMMTKKPSRASSDPDSDQLSTLHFPRLIVLQTWSGRQSILPTWLDVPTTSILISELGFPVYLPSITILCIPDLRGIQGLKSRCPLLVELEVGRRDLKNFAGTYPEFVNDLILVLKERNQQSEVGVEVDGVKMTPLRRLFLPFEQFGAEGLEELRDLVEEVVDLESVSPFIEIEV